VSVSLLGVSWRGITSLLRGALRVKTSSFCRGWSVVASGDGGAGRWCCWKLVGSCCCRGAEGPWLLEDLRCCAWCGDDLSDGRVEEMLPSRRLLPESLAERGGG
jgi:hypothetical protein